MVVVSEIANLPTSRSKSRDFIDQTYHCDVRELQAAEREQGEHTVGRKTERTSGIDGDERQRNTLYTHTQIGK